MCRIRVRVRHKLHGFRVCQNSFTTHVARGAGCATLKRGRIQKTNVATSEVVGTLVKKGKLKKEDNLTHVATFPIPTATP